MKERKASQRAREPPLGGERRPSSKSMAVGPISVGGRRQEHKMHKDGSDYIEGEEHIER